MQFICKILLATQNHEQKRLKTSIFQTKQLTVVWRLRLETSPLFKCI